MKCKTLFAAGFNNHSSGLRWRAHCYPLGQKKELLLPVKARRPDHAVTGNGITSVCFVTVGVKLTRCA
jgi:hypothetical protein